MAQGPHGDIDFLVRSTARDLIDNMANHERRNMEVIIGEVTEAAKAWPRFEGYDIYEVESVVRQILQPLELRAIK